MRVVALPLILLASCAMAADEARLSEKDFFGDIPIVLSVSRLPQPLTEAPDAVTNVKPPVTPFVPGVTPLPGAVTNLKPGVFVPGVAPRPNEITNVKPGATAGSFVPGNRLSPDAVTNVKPAAKPAPRTSQIAAVKPAANDPSQQRLPPLGPGLSWSPDGRFKLKDLGSEYIGEDRGQAQRVIKSNSKTEYFDARRRDAAEVVIRGGKFYTKVTDAAGNVVRGGDGQPQLELMNTKRPNDNSGAIFVMDGQGGIYATNKQEPGKIHHSSLLAGTPVAMGGEMTVVDGVLKGINNVSGHYKPDVDQFGRMQKYLKDELNVKMTGVEARAITITYRPEDKMKGAQVAVEFDMSTGKVINILQRQPVNANGPVEGGFKLSEAVHPNNERPLKLSAEERVRLEVVIDARGRLVYKSEPTRAVDSGPEGGRAIFAIDENGRMFASTANRADPAFTHATLVDGKRVRLAGEIEVHDGKLVNYNNRSAEYATSREQLQAGSFTFLAGGSRQFDRSELRQIGVFESYFVDNPDGSKRAVMLDVSGSKPVVDDPGPPAPPVSQSSAGPRSSVDRPALKRAA